MALALSCNQGYSGPGAAGTGLPAPTFALCTGGAAAYTSCGSATSVWIAGNGGGLSGTMTVFSCIPPTVVPTTQGIHDKSIS